MPFSMPCCQALGVGDEEIVADELAALADEFGQRLPALPVVLGHAVLDRDDREALDEALEIFGHSGAIERLALALQLILAVLEELGGGAVERQHHVFARLVAGLLDRLHDEAKRLVGRLEVGREAALVADCVSWPASFRPFFSVWKISAPMRTASASVLGRDRHDHEFLDVDRVVGMRAAVDDVHHRHGQHVRVGAAEIAVERQAARFRRGLGRRQRHAEDGVGAEPALVAACRRA